MKKLSILLLSFICLCGCTKAQTDTMPTPCTFGLTSFNLVNRAALNEAIPESYEDRASGNPVIYLDFNGQVVANTSWNFNGPFTCAPANLSTAQMQLILDSVTAKYARWKVEVTTNETTFNNAPAYKRQRIIFTETWQWYGQAGGVSFIGSFTWGDTPCFVFTSLLNYNTKFIMEAGVHECGHTLNLYHQSLYDSIPYYPGAFQNEYNPGCCGFAPIMGVAYYQPMSQWVTDYNSQRILQNDAAVIGNILALRKGH